ncbi:MAG: 2-isopropylmalate synthase, partial [Pseudomonadota bacterium]
NGDVYEGAFQAGRRQGPGTMRYASGAVATGNWVEGTLEEDTATITPAADQ